MLGTARYDAAQDFMLGDYVIVSGQRSGLPLPSLSIVGRILATPRGSCLANSAFGVRVRPPGTLTATAPAEIRADIIDALKPVVGTLIQDLTVAVSVRGNRLTAVIDYVDVVSGQRMRLSRNN